MTTDKQNTISREYIAIGLTCLFGWVFAYLGTNVYKNYTFGLFIWLPLIMGASSTILLAYNNMVTKRNCLNVSFLTLFIFCVGLLTFAFEGLICIAMAAPVGLFFTWIGSLISWKIISKKVLGNPPTTLIILILSVPALMSFEFITKEENVKAKPIVTTIEINASAEEVWKNVIEFPQLDEPTEFIFKTGIAYPINAKIEGRGIGAVRHCNFSTGSFVEPITVWDEPKLLRFNVVDQPEPMKEVSFYDLHPNHLHGFFVSKQGQFKLTTLSNGHTLLEGTTWYYNKIKPTAYWTVWSDFIVHKIHERVLTHIKTQSESTTDEKNLPPT